MSNRTTEHAEHCEDSSQYEHDDECRDMRHEGGDAEACFCSPCPECGLGAGLDYTPEAIEAYFDRVEGKNQS